MMVMMSTSVSLEMVTEHTTVSVGVVGHIAVNSTVSLEMVVNHITMSLRQGWGGVVEHITVPLGLEDYISVSLGVEGQISVPWMVEAHISVSLGVVVDWWSTSLCPCGRCVVEHIAVSLGWRSTSQCHFPIQYKKAQMQCQLSCSSINS